jgi:hypothetical protein
LTALDDIRLKLNQAESHLNALSAEVREIVGKHQAIIRAQRNMLDDSYTAILENAPQVRREWGVMLGDFLHNTRSALDHLVSALVVVSGGTVHHRHQFPICDTPQRWRQRVVQPSPTASWLGFIDPSHIAVIEAVQPYQATGLKSLLVLQRFSNADKHRLIHGAVINTTKKPRISGALVVPLMIGEVLYMEPTTPLEDGAALARYKTRALAQGDLAAGMLDFPGQQFQMHVQLNLTTVFGEPGNEDTRIRDFRTCLKDARYIVDRLASVL